MDPTLIMDVQGTTQISPTQPPSICSQVWGLYPTTNLPEWLTTPSSVEGLYTEVKYVYLAGELIKHGFVNADDCPSGGLTLDGASNICGMEKAYTEVVYWQNLFNQEILTAAQEDQIPAQLIKRLFAQETQFWPNTDFKRPAYGLGNVTSPGIDPLFKWNEGIYQDTCRDLFSQPCSEPYSHLGLADQQNLRGYFISQHIDAYCPTCSNGIDLEKTNNSIDYFAKLVVANCQQVDLLLNNYKFSPRALTYEDVWRLTLANYTVGSGCIANGLENMDQSKDFSWESFTTQIDPNCNVNQIINTITR